MTNPHQPAVDRASTLLATTRHRDILSLLRDEPVVTIDDLSAHIAARERSNSPPEKAHRERLTIALIHNHLPRLREAGVIDYDPRSGDVRLEEECQTLWTLLEAYERTDGVPARNHTV